MPEPIRVLCVDDDDPVCGVLERKLGGPEFACRSMRTTDGLLERVERDHPDLVLLDVDIPGCDTVAALRELKRRRPEVGVAALSGMLDDGTIDTVLEAGADGYIAKSEDSATMMELFRRVASGEAILSLDVRLNYAGRFAQVP